MDEDKVMAALGTICIIGLMFLAGFVGSVIKEQDMVKHLYAGMIPYVSTMKTLEWKQP